MNTGGIAQLTIVITNTATPDVFENVLHFQAQQDNVALSTLASAFNTARLTSWLSEMHTSARCALLRVRDILPGTEAGADFAVSPAKQGTQTAEALPYQCAAVLTWRTALAGRAYRGRTYYPLLTEGQTGGMGTLSSGTVTSMQAIADGVLTTFGAAGTDLNWRPGVVSRHLNGVERPNPVITLVTGAVARSILQTQRRRVQGRGA